MLKHAKNRFYDSTMCHCFHICALVSFDYSFDIKTDRKSDTLLKRNNNMYKSTVGGDIGNLFIN